MNTNYTRVPTRFGPETSFEVRPTPAHFRQFHEDGLDGLKNRLLREFLYDRSNPAGNRYVRRAAHEAAALAWVTPFPLLVFPVLFEEKAEAALLQAERQESVRQRSPQLLLV